MFTFCIFDYKILSIVNNSAVLEQMNIFKAMKPEKVYVTAKAVPWVSLRSEGITVALLDFDNTLGPDHATAPTDFSRECVKEIEDAGLRCCLVSNAKSGRSAGIAEALGIPCVTYARKPEPIGVRRALELMKAKPEDAVMIGDQIFTDVIAGNLAGVRTFMVEKLQKKEIWYVALKRIPEKLVRLIGRF